MKFYNTRKYSIGIQIFWSVLVVLLVCLFSYFGKNVIGYKIVALILLMTVSVLAILFEIVPVLLASVLSALIWNFFFIPPIYTFHISNTEDTLMFVLYFVIAMVNAVLTFQIKKEEKKSRDKEEKEKTIKLYDTLLNSLSHELRTPIATIISSVDVLKENNNLLTKINQLELLTAIDIATMRLNRQVENLLNMSRLESGMLQLTMDWCDTNELIHSIIQQFSGIHSHSIVFNENEKLPLIKFDRGLIEQVLQNLIHNAITYTPNNTIINVNASFQNKKCTIEISDNGNGIPEDMNKIIFDKFYRLPNSKTGGSGLGLSIVKGFVEAHQGNVRLKQNKNGGATFIIEFNAEISYINNLKNE